MTDVFSARMYELIVIIYAIAIVLYFIDYIYKNVRARRYAFWLVSIVWVGQTIFFLLFMLEVDRFPILSLFEGIYFYSWLLVTMSIVLHCIAKVDMPVVFINALGFVFMTIHLFAPVDKVETPLLGTSVVSEMLAIHIAIAIISYVAFTVGFVFAVLYLILYRFLKEKKYSPMWARLPSLGQTTKWINNSTLIGIPLLLISLVLGLEWALLTVEDVRLFDVKIVSSFVLSCIYLMLLLFHRSGKLVGTTYAWCHVYTFLLIVLNFFVGNRFSGFHGWY